MAFAFWCYKQKCVFLLLIFLVMYFSFNWYIIGKSCRILNITSDALAASKKHMHDIELMWTDRQTKYIYLNKKSKEQLKDPTSTDVFKIASFTTKNKLPSLADSINSFQILNTTKNPAFIIDTAGCRIPKLDPWDPTVIQFIELLDPLICSRHPIFMKPLPNGIIHLNVSVLQQYYNSTPENINCTYQGIRRIVQPEMDRENGFYMLPEKQLTFNSPIDEEHISVRCFFKDNYTYEQYIPLPKLKDNVEIEKSKQKPSLPLNVILLGIDSVSKLNFFRHFRQTKAFIKERMNVFDMKGYTKVADNTFPNLVPLLTGHFVEYYWNESMADTFYFDNVNLIWKDYARQGYRTFFAEDAPLLGTFNYYRRGFFEQPTDYYYRPLGLKIELSDLRAEVSEYESNSTCLNSELEMDLINDYLLNFVKTMDGRPYFAFTMHSTLTHDVLNYASYADAPTVRLLKTLDEERVLNNTLLVMFSDHGIRYSNIRFTYIGKFEERMPFMYIHVPKWFLQQYPIIERHLYINQNRLITLFDIHATLKHLLDLVQNSLKNADELGLSLFSEIPETRSCDTANIRPHWCPCTSFNPISVGNAAVVNAANAILKHVNGLLLPHADLCETLELKEITDSLQALPSDLVLKFRAIVDNKMMAIGSKPSTLGDYLITIKTQPGDAMFEGTVRYDEKNNIYNVMDISRINMYGKQSWCIDSPKLKLYCYCKSQIT